MKTSPYALRRRLLACSLPALLLLAPMAAGAASDKDHEHARRALEQGQVLPLRSVLERVEREHPGQVLKIEFEKEDGRYIYEIRLLQPDGRLAKLEVDAVDGSVIKMKRKHGKHNKRRDD